MKSREFKKIYHPSLGRYVYEHRGNGLFVDNIMKPLKGAISSAANKAGRAVARAQQLVKKQKLQQRRQQQKLKNQVIL